MSIPNTLTIYIHTSIPGSQFIKYKPSMTIPKIDSKTVYFDPLVKLKQKSIDLTPENNRVAQFFEKNLFKTLISQTENFQDYHTLKQSTETGIVDDNIDLTLKNIFKTDSIFYIDNKPYTIFSVEWERGNWKIDTKMSEMPANYKGQYGSIAYRNALASQLTQAKSELDMLPPETQQGQNYKIENKNVVQNQKVVQKENQVVPYQTKKVEQSEAVVPYQKEKEESQALVPKEKVEESQVVIPKQESQQKPEPKQITNGPISPPEESFIDDVTNNIVASTNKSINLLRSFFKESKYFYLIQNIYKSMTSNDQAIIRETQKKYTKQVGIGSFNKKSYDEIVQSLHIIPNNGKGNCFFVAVAAAINDYNETNKNPITYLDYGLEEKPFTQIVVRTIVANGILGNEEILNNILKVAQINADLMNAEFDSIQQPITDENFNDIVNDIYGKNDNFLIRKPGNVLSDTNIKTPFSAIDTYEERKQYLLDNTWADEKAIPILQQELGLTVIPIEKYQNTYRFPFPSITKHDDPIYNTWNKYMFIYLEAGHYEQMNFDIYLKNEDKKIKQTISIFDKTKPTIPPIDIIFLLYGHFYYPIDEENKKNVLILREYLKQIEINFIKITSETNDSSMKFINDFVYYFPCKKDLLLQEKMNQEFVITTPKKQNKTKKNVSDKKMTSRVQTRKQKRQLLAEEEQAQAEDADADEKEEQAQAEEEKQDLSTENNEEKPQEFPEEKEDLPYDYPLEKPEEKEDVIEEKENSDSIEYHTPITQEEEKENSDSIEYHTPITQLEEKEESIKGGATNATHFTSKFDKKSNISYYIIITLDLYPGTEISAAEKINMTCRKNHNKLQEAWAEMLGKRYSAPPDYDLIKQKNQKQENNKTKK